MWPMPTPAPASAIEAIIKAKQTAMDELGTIAADVTQTVVTDLVGGRWTTKKVADAVAAAMKA